LLDRLNNGLEETLVKLSKKSDTAMAVRYALGRWKRCCATATMVTWKSTQRRGEIVARCGSGRKNYLFAGSDRGGESAAAIYSLIGTAKLNGIDPEAICGTFWSCIAEHPINRIDELLRGISPQTSLKVCATLLLRNK